MTSGTPTAPRRSRVTAAAHALHGFLSERSALLWQLRRAPASAMALAACLLFVAITPTMSAMAFGWLVARLESAVSERGPGEFGWGALVAPLAVVSVLFIAEAALHALAQVAQMSANGQIDRAFRREVRSLALDGLAAWRLDLPETADDLLRASDVGHGRLRSPGSAATGQLLLLFRFLSAGVAAVLLSLTLSPLVAIVLLVVSMCNRGLIRRQWMTLGDAWDARERYRRRSVYWTELGRNPQAGKDIRMFGLGRWLVARRTESFVEYLTPLWPMRRKVMVGQWPIVAMTAGSAVIALLAPGLALRAGAITTPELVTCLLASWLIFGISAMGHEAGDIEYGRGAVRALERLRAEADPADGRSGAPVRFTAEIRCEGVSFAYPGGDAAVIRNLDLEIKAGEVIGLVGRNGVGKTTLIKLLAGLYRPDGGAIRVDGTDLSEIPAARWQRRLSVVFQDFAQIPASLADNIAIGASEHMDDRDGVRRAAHEAGIDRWLDELPGGVDTRLGPEFDDGVDLSGGQWQGVAIARALFAARHGRDLLIFDEPTAHLDAPSEAAFFDRVTSAIQDTAIVLISHRLGTIRHADRIVMLGPDGVIEQGGHEDLMLKGGEYARLFALQSSQFADGDTAAASEPTGRETST